MNTERDLRIASKSNAVPVARWWRTFCGLSHTACYTVFDGAFKPLILLDFSRARIFFNPLLYRLSYRARGGIVTGKIPMLVSGESRSGFDLGCTLTRV